MIMSKYIGTPEVPGRTITKTLGELVAQLLGQSMLERTLVHSSRISVVVN